LRFDCTISNWHSVDLGFVTMPCIVKCTPCLAVKGVLILNYIIKCIAFVCITIHYKLTTILMTCYHWLPPYTTTPLLMYICTAPYKAFALIHLIMKGLPVIFLVARIVLCYCMMVGGCWHTIIHSYYFINYSSGACGCFLPSYYKGWGAGSCRCPFFLVRASADRIFFSPAGKGIRLDPLPPAVHAAVSIGRLGGGFFSPYLTPVLLKVMGPEVRVHPVHACSCSHTVFGFLMFGFNFVEVDRHRKPRMTELPVGHEECCSRDSPPCNDFKESPFVGFDSI
jgi:hypothetical protein